MHNTRTLAQHYRRKLARNRMIRRGLADELLQRVFAPRRPRRAARAGRHPAARAKAAA